MGWLPAKLEDLLLKASMAWEARLEEELQALPVVEDSSWRRFCQMLLSSRTTLTPSKREFFATSSHISKLIGATRLPRKGT
eukprot:6412300-Amphidinium_carterae.2